MKKQILIVDDDQTCWTPCGAPCTVKGMIWAMTFVRHPEKAWEQLLETAYDAVVTDVRMPGMSGFDLLERIRQTEKTKDVPVVMLTGLNDHELKERALDGGAADLLNKPVEPGQLIARLRNVLQLKAYAGRSAGDQRRAGRQGPPAERRPGPLADERRLPAGDGGRVPRRGHGEPRDSRGLLQPRRGGGDGHAPLVPGDAAVGGAAARHRQDRHSRQRAAEARTVERRRVGRHAAALRDRREHPPRAVEGRGAAVRLVRRRAARR